MNCFIWHLEAIEKRNIRPEQRWTQKTYRMMLVEALVGGELDKQELESAGIKERGLSKEKWKKETSRLRGRHFPAQVEQTEEQRGAGKLQNVATAEEYAEGLKKQVKYKRSTCIMCGTLVNTQCLQCKAFLCLKTQSGVDNCWKTFHTERNFPEAVEESSESDEEEEEYNYISLRSRNLKI